MSIRGENVIDLPFIYSAVVVMSPKLVCPRTPFIAVILRHMHQNYLLYYTLFFF